MSTTESSPMTARRADLVEIRNTSNGFAWFAVVGRSEYGRAELRRRGSTWWVDARGVDLRRQVLVERLTREQCGELEHPTACPECSRPGNYSITLADHDRLWCQDCGHQWEVPIAVFEVHGLSTCLGCSVGIIHEDEIYCASCAENRKESER